MTHKISKLICIKLLLLLSIVLFSLSCLAHERTSKKLDHNSLRVFTSYESNGKDFIEGIGIGLTFTDKNNHLGFQLNTSFNNAEVKATDGYTEDFFAWQGSAKFGYFSTVSIYAEVGIDLTELFFHDLRHDSHDDYYDDYYEDDIDSFIGVGFGIKIGPIRAEAFTRLREIDGQYWEAESEVFHGVQLSINF